MNLLILGLVYDVIGVFILTLVAILDPPHQRCYDEKGLGKRYWWSGWRPIYRDTKTLKWKIKLDSIVVRHGAIPPKYQWNIIGFVFILFGFIFQLKFYLS
jgi:hypothetical protein